MQGIPGSASPRVALRFAQPAVTRTKGCEIPDRVLAVLISFITLARPNRFTSILRSREGGPCSSHPPEG
jgi:hypothetical protein